MYNICLYFFMFYFYSVFGWVIECIDQTIEQKRFINNRGFFIGPYCPIYGFGAAYMYLFLNRYYDDIAVLFVMAVVGTSTIEYVTSFLMEKIFKARWWDYSHMKFNLEGRICLRNSLLFGLLGIAFVYIINPTLLFVINKMPETVLIIISTILFITFMIDIITTFSIMSSLKNKLISIKKDSTYDIDKQVKEILSKNTFYLKKLFRSFPRVRLSFPTGEKILSSIYKCLDSIDPKKKKVKKQKN